MLKGFNKFVQAITDIQIHGNFGSPTYKAN